MQITNNQDIPLLFSVWLMQDKYDYIHDPKYISATSLLRPTQELILSSRVVPNEDDSMDLSELVARSLGNAIHDSVEQAWSNIEAVSEAMIHLGIDENTAKGIIVNPTDDEVKNGAIPLYFEQRKVVEFNGFKIGGKYDAVLDGVLHDIKSTSTFAWTNNTNDENYKLQGSIYRWLNQDKITSDFIRVCFLFTDWQAFRAKQNPNYPQCRITYRDIPLLSIEETEAWIKERIDLLVKYQDVDAVELPQCTDEDVWLSDITYRYFSNPNKVDGRATRVFPAYEEANAHLIKQQKGVIISTTPVAKKCKKYCNAFDLCMQKDKFEHPED